MRVKGPISITEINIGSKLYPVIHGVIANVTREEFVAIQHLGFVRYPLTNEEIEQLKRDCNT